MSEHHDSPSSLGEHVKDKLHHHACQMKYKSCSMMDSSSEEYDACMKQYQKHCSEHHHDKEQHIMHAIKHDARDYHLSHEHYKQ